MKTQPRRLFRDRRLPEQPHDRRRVDQIAASAQSSPMPDLASIFDLSRHVVIVPVHRFIDTDTYHCLRGLEDLGIRVEFSKGASAIDLTRSMHASEALKLGIESFFFIDSDMLFDPADVVRLFLRPEPVVAGVYAAKVMGRGRLNAYWPSHIKRIKLGDWAPEGYPVRRIGAGFLRIKTTVLKEMVDKLSLPYCLMGEGEAWPFFQPTIIEENGRHVYLTEDYAFCSRCEQIGVPIVADTRFRVYHLGEYAFGWEEAKGEYIVRTKNVECELETRVA